MREIRSNAVMNEWNQLRYIFIGSNTTQLEQILNFCETSLALIFLRSYLANRKPKEAFFSILEVWSALKECEIIYSGCCTSSSPALFFFKIRILLIVSLFLKCSLQNAACKSLLCDRYPIRYHARFLNEALVSGLTHRQWSLPPVLQKGPFG